MLLLMFFCSLGFFLFTYFQILQQFSFEYVRLQFHTTRQKQKPRAVRDCLVLILKLFLFRPSTVILVIVGGLAFSGISANELTALFLLCIVVIAFCLVCLFTTQKFQLKIAKILTFVFAIIMIMVAIGVAVQISKEIKDRRSHPALAPTLEPNATGTTSGAPLEHHLPVGVSTLYLAGLTAIFIGGAALHPSESLCLLNGVWYLLCLPSGYLFLTVYSLCNLTDRSWGECCTASVTRKGEEGVKPFTAGRGELVVHQREGESASKCPLRKGIWKR